MTPGHTTFQMLIPQAVLASNGLENWTLYAGAATMEELEAHAAQAKIPRYAIMALVCVKVGVARPALHLVTADDDRPLFGQASGPLAPPAGEG